MNEYRPVWLTASFFDFNTSDPAAVQHAFELLWELFEAAPSDPIQAALLAAGSVKHSPAVWDALRALGMPRPKELDVPEST